MNTVPKLALKISGHRGDSCLVLGNALGTDIDIWAPQEADLAGHVCVVRFDLPGHGSASDGAYGCIADLARVLLASLAHEHLTNFAYAGVSMGGALGMELARLAPQRVQALVLANTAASFGPPAFWDGRIAQAGSDGVASLADAAVSRWLTPAFAQANPAIATRLRRMFARTSVPGYVQACRALRDFDAREQLSAISVPTLIVAGADDEATPKARSQDLHRAIAGSRYVAMPAAHLANVGCPGEFTMALRSFLEVHTSI